MSTRKPPQSQFRTTFARSSHCTCRLTQGWTTSLTTHDVHPTGCASNPIHQPPTHSQQRTPHPGHSGRVLLNPPTTGCICFLAGVQCTAPWDMDNLNAQYAAPVVHCTQWDVDNRARSTAHIMCCGGMLARPGIIPTTSARLLAVRAARGQYTVST